MRPALPIAVLGLCAVLLAGCSGGTASNGPDGQSASAEGSLAYNGASSGTQTSRPFACDGSGEVALSSNLGSGTLTVTVRDSAGKAVYTKATSGPGQAADSKGVSGAPGDWTIVAVRGTGFTGQYAVNVGC